ncbi:MAG: glycosyltransferase [Clostridiales bacterium]|nr:glycosyltransferase [Clostridiales bacterium]
MNDLVSIIMPSYNTAKYIKESIDSVINQTYSNWELIIVDDCSKDETENLVKQYKDERIKFIKKEKNSGAADSRNKALLLAKGKWIAFLDSDDIWATDKLEKQIIFMEENNYAFSYTNYTRIDQNSVPLNIVCTGPKVVPFSKMKRYCYPGCLTVMYNVEVVGLIQIINIKKNNDYAMWLKVARKATCYLLNQELAQYRVRDKSISHDKLLKKLRSHYELFRVSENKSVLFAIVCACRNVFYGILKKWVYEKHIEG